MKPSLAYKLLDAAQWRAAQGDGVYRGSAVDLADGYIHMSDAEQLAETARRHYAGQENLTLLTVDLSRLDPTALVWEPSRGGALFPHLYAALPVDTVREAKDCIVDAEGRLIVSDRRTT